MTTAAPTAASTLDESLKYEIKRLTDLQMMISSLDASNVQEIGEAILADGSLFSENFIHTLANTIVWVGFACYDEKAALELVRLLLRNQAFKDSIWTSLLIPCDPVVLKARVEFIRRAVDSGVLSAADAVPVLKENLGGDPVVLCAMFLAVAPEIEANDQELFEALKKHLESPNEPVAKEFALAREMFDQLRENEWQLYRAFWKGECVDAFEDVFAEDDVGYLNKLMSEGSLDKDYTVKSNWLRGEMRLVDLAVEKKAAKCVAFLCNLAGDRRFPLAVAKCEELAMSLLAMTNDASSIVDGAILYHRNGMVKKLVLAEGYKWNLKTDEQGVAKLLNSAVSANNLQAIAMLKVDLEPDSDMLIVLHRVMTYKHTTMVWYFVQQNAKSEVGKGINQQVFAALIDMGDEANAMLVLTIDPSVQIYRQLAITMAAKGLWKLAAACLSQGKIDEYNGHLLFEGLAVSSNVNFSPGMLKVVTTSETKLPASLIQFLVRLAVLRHDVGTLSAILKAYQIDLRSPNVYFSFIESRFL